MQNIASCLLRPLDLSDLADTDGGAGTTALAVLFLFRIPSLRPGPLPDTIAASITSSRATSWATSTATS
jgi:hypothetical protein